MAAHIRDSVHLDVAKGRAKGDWRREKGRGMMERGWKEERKGRKGGRGWNERGEVGGAEMKRAGGRRGRLELS